jgi:hypothetical protein
MLELVMNTNTLPEPLNKLIQSEKFKVREEDGEIRLTPIKETQKRCPLRGMFSDGRISSYRFIENKTAEKELER